MYNGWSNYETWNCKLWQDNGPACEYWADRARELVRRSDDAVSTLAREMRCYYFERQPELNGFYGDVLTAAIGHVDFREIAEAYVADVEVDA